MYIKIVGGTFSNAGDHLMLVAAVKALRAMHPTPDIVSSILGETTYSDRAVLGLYQTVLRPRRLCFARVVGVPILRRYGHLFGIVPDDRITAILDMSGYAYADRWGLDILRERLRDYKAARTQGKKIILLPQAFGPFESSISRKLVASLMECVDVAYARDRFSLAQLRDAVGDCEKIRLAPEFTQVLTQDQLPERTTELKGAVALVPNIQVIRQSRGISFDSYLAFWKRVAVGIRALGYKPVLIQFSRDLDTEIIDAIQVQNPGISLIRSRDPLTLRAVLGACRAAVCSRYHALVSAYSQGVPAITTSWSHKYSEFAKEYEMGDCVVAVNTSENNLYQALDNIVGANRDSLSAKLLDISHRMIASVWNMWREIAEILSLDFSVPPHIDGAKQRCWQS